MDMKVTPLGFDHPPSDLFMAFDKIGGGDGGKKSRQNQLKGVKDSNTFMTVEPKLVRNLESGVASIGDSPDLISKLNQEFREQRASRE